MVGRHSVENKIQRLLDGLQALRILGDDKLIRANLNGYLPLAGRGGDGHHGVAHGLGQPDAHLAEAATPTTPTRLPPEVAFHVLSGENMVMPAQRMGPAASRG